MSEKHRLYVLTFTRETPNEGVVKECLLDYQVDVYDKLTRQLAEHARRILSENEYGYPRVYDLSYSDRNLEVRYVEDINITESYQIEEKVFETC